MIKHTGDMMGWEATNVSIDHMTSSEQRMQLDRLPSVENESSRSLPGDMDMKPGPNMHGWANNKRKATNSSPSSSLHRRCCQDKDHSRPSPKQERPSFEDFQGTTPWSEAETSRFSRLNSAQQDHQESPGKDETSTTETMTTNNEVPPAPEAMWPHTPTSKNDRVGLPKKRQRYQRRNSFLIRRDSTRLFASTSSIMQDINTACFGGLLDDEDSVLEGGARSALPAWRQAYQAGSYTIDDDGSLSELPLVPSLANARAKLDDEQQGGRDGGDGQWWDRAGAVMSQWGHASWGNSDDTKWYSTFSSLSFDSKPTIPVALAGRRDHKADVEEVVDHVKNSSTTAADDDDAKTSSTMLPPPPPRAASPLPFVRPKCWSSAISSDEETSSCPKTRTDHEGRSPTEMVAEQQEGAVAPDC